MKLLIDYYKRVILNYICGSTLTNTKIRNLIALHFIKSIREKSILGNYDTNFLSYDTMYVVYLPEPVYKKSRKELIMIVQASTREFEFILRSKVDSKKFPNFNLPHSPYWQFLFQPVPSGSKISGNNQIVDDNSMIIESETFPEGRDKNTKDQRAQVISIRSRRSTGMSETYFNKDAFVEVHPISEGEFVVPFGMSSFKREVSNVKQSALLTLSISNASFLVDGKKTNIYKLTTNELYIAGKNANDTYNGIRVLRICDNHIMNPHLHILCAKGNITIEAKGDVTYRHKKIGSNGTVISKGSSILINKTIQLEIN